MRALLLCCIGACALPAAACTCSERDTPRERPAPPRADHSATASPGAAPDAAPHAVAVPALFRPLFAQGHAWTYDYSYEYPDHIPFSGATTMLLDGILRCRVEEARSVGLHRLSKVRCRLFEEGEDLAGIGEEAVHALGDNVFVADERGLWIGDPDACKTLSKACVAALKGPPSLPAAPRARREVKKKGQEVVTTSVRRETIRVGEVATLAWCRRLESVDKDDRFSMERCYAPGHGLVREASSLKKLNVAEPDEEAAQGDPSWWKGSITQTGELKLKPKPAPAAAQ